MWDILEIFAFDVQGGGEGRGEAGGVASLLHTADNEL